MENKKPFRETKLGKWITEKAPDVLVGVGDLLPDQGMIGIVKRAINKIPNLTKEEKAEFEKLSKEYELEIFGMVLADVADARNMQIEALKQEDKFSKRYIYFLGSFMIISATTFGILLFFIDVPESNKRMIEMFCDIYLFAGAVTVLQFFFGSSKGSQDKTKMLSS